MTDLHVHTAFSFDSEELPENYIAEANGRGDKFLGFAEHYDFGDPLGGDKLDFSAYDKKIRALNGGDSGVKILKGIELGYSKNAEKVYAGLLNEGNFDYAILSVHSVGERGDCYYPEFYAGLDKTQAYMLYLNAVLQSVNANLNVHTVGHIGYITRYSPYEDKRIACKPFMPIINDILKTIIARGICLELNTSTGGTCDFVPEVELVETYLSLGGKNFTFGSDAHSVKRYKQNADKVKKFLIDRGICAVYRFEQGKMIKEEL